MSITLVRLVQRAPLRACYAVSLHEENLGETGAGHLCVTPCLSYLLLLTLSGGI